MLPAFKCADIIRPGSCHANDPYGCGFEFIELCCAHYLYLYLCNARYGGAADVVSSTAVRALYTLPTLYYRLLLLCSFVCPVTNLFPNCYLLTLLSRVH